MAFGRFVSSKYFAIADLLLISVSIIISEIYPQFGFYPLLLGFFPWLLRISTRQFPFRRTSFDWLILIFLLTAIMGIWAAFNFEQAVHKFILLVEGTLFFYALAGQPKDNLWPLACFFAWVGVGMAAFFLFTNDWHAFPAKLNIMNQIGIWWMDMRPALNLSSPHPNDVAGIVACTAPFLIAFGLRSWRSQRFHHLLWVVPGVLIGLASFSLATSRGAATAVVLAVSLWLVKFVIDYLRKRFAGQKARRNLYVSLFGFLFVVVVFFLILSRTTLPQFVSQVYSASGRQGFALGGLKLFADFPFTGGGLGGFPGLYSNYIAVIPYYVIISSHNTFLDVGIEQGVLGMLSFALVYCGCIFLLIPLLYKRQLTILAGASITSLVILIFHGMVDNIIYDGGSGPIVFLFAGMAAAILSNANQKVSYPPPDFTRIWKKSNLLVAVVFAAIFIGGLIYFRKPLLASWLADLGAVRMAKVELANFPANKWYEGENIQAFEPAAAFFQDALLLDPDQPTANYRLGMIAMMHRDFTSAVQYLENANRGRRDHPGIIKCLAYSYIWSGKFDAAKPLVASIPDAEQELQVYVWWWQTQGRADLAEKAQQMLAQFPSQ